MQIINLFFFYDFAACFVVAVSKEIHDILRDKSIRLENALDVLATMLGGVVFYGLVRLVS